MDVSNRSVSSLVSVSRSGRFCCSSPLPAGEYLMTASVRRNKEGQWQLRVTLGSATMGQTFSSEHVDWLIDEVGV